MDVDVDGAGQDVAAARRDALARRRHQALLPHRNDPATIDCDGSFDYSVSAGNAAVHDNRVDKWRNKAVLGQLTCRRVSKIVHESATRGIPQTIEKREKNRKMRNSPQKRKTGREAAETAIVPPEKAAVSEETVSADIFRLLRSDIISGTLQPGARLRFIELHARYDIGTSPLREALSRLAADRLVIQEVNRGFSVPPISLEDFADIARLRSALERGAIEASIARGDETWEEQVVLAHHRLRRLGRQELDPQDEAIPEEWERRHRAFHTALIAACGSPWTLHFCGVLYDQFDRYRRRVGRDATIQAGLSRQHDQLVEAAIARDAAHAGAILEDHINITTKTVSKRLRSVA